MYHHYQLPLLMLLLFGIASCVSSRQADNMAYLYNDKAAVQYAKIQVYHTDHDSSTLFIGIPKTGLDFNVKGITELDINLLFYREGRLKKFADSIRFRTSISDSITGDYISVKKDLPIARGEQVLVKVIIHQVHTQKRWEQQHWMEKHHTTDEDNFLIRQDSASTNSVLFEPYTFVGDSLFIDYRGKRNPELLVNYYPPVRQLALPPFEMRRKAPFPSQSEADSSFYIKNGVFYPQKAGLYHLRYSPTDSFGRSIVVAEDGFPKLTTVPDLVETLRFITKKAEYKSLMTAKTPKAALDQFWLKRSGSQDRGKILIKEFYGRVQKTNKLFTTFKEGWKTDRGLIFIIYGEPDVLNKTQNREIWTYRGSSDRPSLQFVFNRKYISFSKHFYELERDPALADAWHHAVYEWRRGFIRNPSGQ